MISFERGKGGSLAYQVNEGGIATIDCGNTLIQVRGESNGGSFMISGGNTLIYLELKKDEKSEKPTTITEDFIINNRIHQFTITAS